eukprot:8342909-Karenia_brevis.AAC.1
MQLGKSLQEILQHAYLEPAQLVTQLQSIQALVSHIFPQTSPSAHSSPHPSVIPPVVISPSQPSTESGTDHSGTSA